MKQLINIVKDNKMKKVILSATLFMLSINSNAAVFVEAEPFFSSTECNKSPNAEYLKNLLDVCSTYNLKLIEEEKYDSIYTLVRKPEINVDWTTFTVVDTFNLDSNKLSVVEVFELDKEGYKYGVRSCQGVVCQMVVDEITFLTDGQPASCI
jgi:hypothetical protein